MYLPFPAYSAFCNIFRTFFRFLPSSKNDYQFLMVRCLNFIIKSPKHFFTGKIKPDIPANLIRKQRIIHKVRIFILDLMIRCSLHNFIAVNSGLVSPKVPFICQYFSCSPSIISLILPAYQINLIYR